VSQIGVSRLFVSLAGRRVLESLSIALAPGEWVCLVGPNGAGKTTLLRALAGLVPYSGSVTIGGAEVSRLARRALAQQVAFVPQAPVLPPAMTVEEYVLLGRTPHLAYFARETQADFQATREALARLDLGAFAERPLGTMSGGERQRAVLARALAQQAQILLLDEPTSALDIGRQQQALELVDGLRTQLELTVVSAMHDLTMASQYAARVALLSGGRLIADGTAGEVLTAERVAEHYEARVEIVASGQGIAVLPTRQAAVTELGAPR
jgi:iron complex transport system ATP-binding protein